MACTHLHRINVKLVCLAIDFLALFIISFLIRINADEIFHENFNSLCAAQTQLIDFAHSRIQQLGIYILIFFRVGFFY